MEGVRKISVAEAKCGIFSDQPTNDDYAGDDDDDDGGDDDDKKVRIGCAVVKGMGTDK